MAQARVVSFWRCCTAVTAVVSPFLCWFIHSFIQRLLSRLRRPRYGCAVLISCLVSVIRLLTGAGNSGRLLEMLHGSDGWEKLALQLQQKEEEEAKQQHQQAAQNEEEDGNQQSKQPAANRKRRQPAGSDAVPKAVR